LKALVFHGPRRFEWEDVPDPAIDDDQLLVRVRAVGVCGSDLHGYLGITGRRIPPMIMGHELSGEVVHTGRRVSRFVPGDRVCVQPIQFCGTCEFCRAGEQNVCPNKRILGVMDVNGAMAELVAVNEQNAFALTEAISFVDGSMIEPFSVAHSAVKAALSVEGREVAIIGMGTIGLSILQFVKLGEARRVFAVDISDTRLSVAGDLGADVLINPQKEDALQVVRDHTHQRGADIVFEAVGASATARSSLDLTRIKGHTVWVGNSERIVEIDMQKVVISELTVRGVYGFTTATFKETLALMNEGKLNPKEIVSIEEHISRGGAVFEKLLADKEKYIKAVLTNE
jgi:threonine dehydrogenase-like Zn-dependent dehydrogenase